MEGDPISAGLALSGCHSRVSRVDRSKAEEYREVSERVVGTIVQGRITRNWNAAVDMVVHTQAEKLAASGEYDSVGDRDAIVAAAGSEVSRMRDIYRAVTALPIHAAVVDHVERARQIFYHEDLSLRARLLIADFLVAAGIEVHLHKPGQRTRHTRIFETCATKLAEGTIKDLITFGFRVEACNDLLERQILAITAKQRQKVIIRRSGSGEPLPLSDVIGREFESLIVAHERLDSLERMYHGEAAKHGEIVASGLQDLIHLLYDIVANADTRGDRRNEDITDMQTLIGCLNANNYNKALAIAVKLGYIL